MKFGSLFSGIGGFDLGFENAGMQCAWQVEQDSHCQNVLKKHWSDIKLYNDVKEIGEHNLETVDLICGGFPCQDVSTAGKRAGFDGERSSLWFEFERIIAELLPRWVVIENVPGLLSSRGGEDFKTVIKALDELRYGVSWRIFDSRYFGVAQRRRRVFIVASLGDLRSAQVLLDTESLPWDSRASGENRQDASGESLQTDSGSSKQEVIAFQRSQLRTNKSVELLDIVPTLKAHTKSGDTETTIWQMNHASEVYREVWSAQNRLETYKPEIAPTLQARMGTGGNNVPLVGLRRLTPTECCRLQGFPEIEERISVKICLDHQKKNALVGMKNLKLLEHASNVQNAPKQENVRFAESNLPIKNQQTEKHAHLNVLINCEASTLQIRNQEKLLLNANGVEKKSLYPPHIQIEDFVLINALMNTILERKTTIGKVELLQREQFLTRVTSGENLENIYGKETMRHVEDVVKDLLGSKKPITATISNLLEKYPSDLILIILFYFVMNAIILFIPTEIQGKNFLIINFKKTYGWNAFGANGKQISDTQRYKQLGNAVTVPVAEWLGKRIIEFS